jgi:hypothetical protein
MDYFSYNARRKAPPARDVVSFDRSLDDTARILRDERGNAAGFVVEGENVPMGEQAAREFRERWARAYGAK